MEKEELGFVLVKEKERMGVPKPEERTVGFYCRCCGGQTYHKATKNNGVMGPGGWVKTLYYTCNSCSVLFQDPEKFSK